MSEDLPFGSRGGAAVSHYFPADGDYVITVKLQRTGYDYIRGLGANSYIVKPVDFVQFTQAVVQLGFFWMFLNQPPP